MGLMHKLGRLGEQVVEVVERRMRLVKPEGNDVGEHVLSIRKQARSVFRDEYKNSPENVLARRQLLAIFKKNYDVIVEQILKRDVRRIPRWEDIEALFTADVLDDLNGKKAFYNPHLLLFPNGENHEVWTVSIIHSENNRYYQLFFWEVKGSKI